MFRECITTIEWGRLRYPAVISMEDTRDNTRLTQTHLERLVYCNSSLPTLTTSDLGVES